MVQVEKGNFYEIVCCFEPADEPESDVLHLRQVIATLFVALKLNLFTQRIISLQRVGEYCFSRFAFQPSVVVTRVSAAVLHGSK
jgi:hypothetical protein